MSFQTLLTPHPGRRISTSALPFVSVVVPCYNAAKTIDACLRSLMAQTYPRERCEVIVVDNGSTDASVAHIRRFPVQLVIETAQRGAYAARNRGIQAARGELIAFTDADCIAQPPWLRQLIDGWEDDRVGVLAGRVSAYRPTSVLERFATRRQQVSQDASMACSYLPYAITANAAYPRRMLEALGGFDATLRSGGDADLSWRAQLEQEKTIRFNRKAIVEHQHRRTWGAFLRQHRTYGAGTAMLYARFPGYRKSLSAESWWWLRRTSLFLARGLSRLVRFPARRHEGRMYFAEHFLEAACTTSRFLGLVHSTLISQRRAGRPQPVRAGSA